jgi:tRNA threonylcarbamoyladenosine biosynthesis protein TsaB
MLILALDTATREGSCALARDGIVLAEAASDASRPQAARLPGDLMALLDQVGLGLPAIDIYAVATGPGSFTGLRVGIATMQGLAFAAQQPLVGISAFDALAQVAAEDVPARTGEAPDLTATWIDAWRGEVYAALYDATRAIEPPTVERPEAILARLRGRPTRFTGDGARTYAERIHETLGAEARLSDPPAPLLAGAIARLAWRAASAGERPRPHAIRPLYVRRPDAELARDVRSRS